MSRPIRPNLRRRPLLALVAVATVVTGLVAPSAVSKAPTAAAADHEFPYQDASLPIVVRVDVAADAPAAIVHQPTLLGHGEAWSAETMETITVRAS